MKSIVIIDDDAWLRETVKTRLDGAGFRGLGAGSGEAGISLVEAHYPDLVLLDIELPGKNGVKVLKLLKQNPLTRDVPVIMISSIDKREIVVTAIQSGAVDYIVKPLDMDRMLQKVERALSISGLERKEQRRGSEGQIELKRIPGVSFFIFSGLLSRKSVPAFEGLYSKSFQAMARGDELVFDLRYQQGIDREQLSVVGALLTLARKPPRILAGRNYAAMLALDLQAPEEQLFISEEDLEKQLSQSIGVVQL